MPEEQAPSPTATDAERVAGYLDAIAITERAIPDEGDAEMVRRAAVMLREMAAAQEQMLAALRPFVDFINVVEQGFTPGWSERTHPNKVMLGMNEGRLSLANFLAARAALAAAQEPRA